jgi:signal transduction histidine kinase
MTVLTSILIVAALSLFFWVFRSHITSLFYYLLVRFERRRIDFHLLSSLRDDLVHERKKKMAGLEMILSSWEKGEEVQSRYEYFEELLGQLKNLVHEERRNLATVTKDIWLWAKLRKILNGVEKASRRNRVQSNILKLKEDFVRLQNLIDDVVEGATEKFSFSLNEAVRECVKIVGVEKSQLKNIKIKEQLDGAGNTIRFSYAKFKEWQRVLTNLIRNAVEAVEAKQSEAGGLGLVAAPPEAGEGGDETVGADFSLRGGEEGRVKVSTKPSRPVSVLDSVSVIIEDSGIGMDETTKDSFYKKGFTSGKEEGLGLGISEESVEFINRYGSWQIESQQGVGTKITINIDREKAQKAELLLPEPKPFFQTKLAFGLSFSLLALIALALLFGFHKYSRFWVDWNPAYARVEQGRHISVFNSEGKELWEHELERSVYIREETPDVKVPLVKIEDLDQDGRNETLAATVSGVQVPGQLFCFDHRGNMLWVFTAGEGFEGTSHAQRQKQKPDIFEITNFLVDDFMDGLRKEILVNARLYALYPCQLALLHHQGDVIGEYWHPGCIFFSVYTDLDGNGEKELLCAGINNKLNCRAVVFTLDVREPIGKVQGPPYSIFGDLKPATEKKYIVLPHIKDVVWNWVEVSPFATPRYMDVRPDHIFVMLPDGRHYSLTTSLEYNSCEHRFSFFSGWQKLIKFPFEFNLGADSLNWKNFEIWEDGLKVK